MTTARLPRTGVVAGAAAVLALVFVAGGSARHQAVPANTQEPSVSGAALVGKTLTGHRGTWTGASSYADSWLRCDANAANCSSISGATQTKYTAVSADLGSTLRFRVTASNADGKASADSNPTAVVATSGGQPANTTPPTISGSPIVGQQLSATTGSWVGDQPITYSYQWMHCDTAGNACNSISDATKQTYTVVKGQVGNTIRVKVIAKNSRGSANALSVQTAAVQDAGGSSGIINLPNGGKSVDAADVPKGERLIVDKVGFNPSTVKSRSKPIVVKVTVKDTRGYFVRNAVVFIRSTPLVTSSGDNQKTATDGTISYSLTPESDFPIKNGYSVQFFVKAYRTGDPSLAGISGTRLVQVATSTG